jgi:AraC-like DNA-binding protein
MKVNAYKPNNELLASVIECFYFLSREDGEPNTRYLTFPSVNSIWSINSNTKVVKNQNIYQIQEAKNTLINSAIVCRFKEAFCFEYRGAAEEITVYFKPLGINAFLDKPLNVYTEGIENLFLPFEDLREFFQTIFNEKLSEKEKLERIETYFLSKHKGFNHPFLHPFLLELEKDNHTINELATNFNTTPKTVIKHFEKHLCKSPKEYQKIIRFRKALAKIQVQKEPLSMTELSYILNYFDQSHLIREFRSLTGYTPTYFFKNISRLEAGKINWMFL